MEYNDIIIIINNRKCPKCGDKLHPQNMGYYWLIGCLCCGYLEDTDGFETKLKTNDTPPSYCDEIEDY